MTLRSAIYVGSVRHRRRAPAHTFTFPLFMLYLDLDEVERVFSLTRLWGTSRWCPARFRRSDYLSHGTLGLAESVRACVEERLGLRPTGPTRMLTHLRFFGYVFNPVTFYYCYDEHDSLLAIVAEITNTPWKERHAYVLDTRASRRGGPGGHVMRWRFAKDFHVSPFLPMDLEYDWTFDVPDDSLFVHMNVREAGPTASKAFDATLQLRRRELSPSLLRGLIFRFPLMTLQVIISIHYQALKLWLKRATVHRHPRARPPVPVPSTSEAHP